jgi:hypothetical protein
MIREGRLRFTEGYDRSYGGLHLALKLYSGGMVLEGPGKDPSGGEPLAEPDEGDTGISLSWSPVALYCQCFLELYLWSPRMSNDH